MDDPAIQARRHVTSSEHIRMPQIQSPLRRAVSQPSMPGDDRPESLLPDESLFFTRPPGKPLSVWGSTDDDNTDCPNYHGSIKTYSKKRPRSPSVNSKLKPISNDMKSPRRMRSFLLNFLADDVGTFRTEINLYQHAVDSGLAVTDATVQEVAHLVPGLTSLELSNCIDVTDAGIWSVARHCPGLTSIYLSKCEKITDLGLRVLAHQCRLVTVDLTDCGQIGDLALATLAAGCWTIETLVLARCVAITDAGIAKIAQCCKSLTHLDVSECAHVGEFGDKALVELGKWCGRLRHLDLFGCRHVRDMGVRAVAAGCPHLSTLKLTGCRDVSSASIHELADRCHALERLSLAGCIRTQNDDLLRLAKSCTCLKWLDISGSPNITNRGVAALAQHCKALEHLNLSQCPHVSDKVCMGFSQLDGREESSQSLVSLQVLQTMAQHMTSITSLSLVDCGRITEAGIDALTTACTKLFTLNMTNCQHIRRRYLHQLVERLEFVDWSSTFFGIEPLPNAMELQVLKERRLHRQASAIKIQAVIRGCLARGGIHGALLRRVVRDVLPKIQARVRGFLARAAYRRTRLAIVQQTKSCVIQRAYRYYKVKQLCRRARRLMRIRLNEEAAALIFQKIFRGHRHRVFVHRMRDELRRIAQLDSRRHAMTEVAAIRLQRLWRGHKGRGDVALRKKLIEMQRLQEAKEHAAASYLQRIYRGHNGRKDFAKRLVEREKVRMLHARASQIQRAHRNHVAWEARKVRLVKEAEAQKLRAVIRIQKNWRGVRERQLGTIMLGLVQLRRQEDKAARIIQSLCRGYVSRNFMKAMKMVLAAQERRDRSILLLQRIFRGYKGREAAEVKFELRKLEVVAKPLFIKIHTYSGRVAALSAKVDALRRSLATDQADEAELALELDKTMTIKSKFHDSARITGAKQRYLTRYLQVQLADQLQKKRMAVAVHTRNLEVAVGEYSEAEKQLRIAKRELQPLTEGVERKTKENRVRRLQVKVRREKKAATAIQRHFRGYRVRAAVGEGANRWLELFDPTTNRKYYYNAWNQVRREVRPLAMDIFGDGFVQPFRADAAMKDWFQCLDELSGSFYFYNCRTHEYRWDVPTSDQTRDVFEAQPHDQLTQRSTSRRSIGKSAWKELVDSESGVVYYHNAQTGESVWSLPPQQVYGENGGGLGRSQVSVGGSTTRRRLRTASSLNQQPSLQWQYYYGYDVAHNTGLVTKRSEPRSPWVEMFDETYELPYYHNVLTQEYRWTKPDEFDELLPEGTVPGLSPGHEWFDHQDKEQLSSRSHVAKREIGAQWTEYVDIDTGHAYYFNTVTGETRWSLSPRSAREDPPIGAQTRMPLTLKAKLASFNASTPVEYDGRGDHVAWLFDSIEAKEWVKAEGILEEILAKEQGQTGWQYVAATIREDGTHQEAYWYNATTGESAPG